MSLTRQQIRSQLSENMADLRKACYDCERDLDAGRDLTDGELITRLERYIEEVEAGLKVHLSRQRPVVAKFPCSECHGEIGFDAPSGLCAACLRKANHHGQVMPKSAADLLARDYAKGNLTPAAAAQADRCNVNEANTPVAELHRCAFCDEKPGAIDGGIGDGGPNFCSQECADHYWAGDGLAPESRAAVKDGTAAGHLIQRPDEVAADHACPKCGEKRMDYLVIGDDDTVACSTCKGTYALLATQPELTVVDTEDRLLADSLLVMRRLDRALVTLTTRVRLVRELVGQAINAEAEIEGEAEVIAELKQHLLNAQAAVVAYENHARNVKACSIK